MTGHIEFVSNYTLIRLYYEISSNIGDQGSTLRIYGQGATRLDYPVWGTFWADGQILVNGNPAITFSLGASDGAVNLAPVDSEDRIGYKEWDGFIPQPGGQATNVTISIKGNGYGQWIFYQSGYGQIAFADSSGTITLPAIPQRYTFRHQSGSGFGVSCEILDSPATGWRGPVGNGGAIHTGDLIRVSVNGYTGYTVPDTYINHNRFTGGSIDWTVTSDVSIDIANSPIEYTYSQPSGAGYSISAAIVSSPIGGSTGWIGNGSKIYFNDVIRVTVSANAGYDIYGVSINGYGTGTTADWTASGNVSVSIDARPHKYTYRQPSGTGYTISASRISSPITGSTGAIGDGEGIYHGDVIHISVSAQPGYEVDSVTVNGNKLSGDVTVTGDTSVSVSAKLQGAVYIDGEMYFAFIDNGSNFQQYIPQLDTGSNWAILG